MENIIMKQSKWGASDIPLLFEQEPVHFSDANNMEELMVELGIYPSLSAARRDGRSGTVPTGFTFEYKASKVKRLWIWNPDKALE